MYETKKQNDSHFVCVCLGQRGCVHAQQQHTRAAAASSLAAGSQALSTGVNALAIGSGATAGGSSSIAIGESTSASSANATAIGSGATAMADNAAAFGAGASSIYTNSTAIGAGASSTRSDQKGARRSERAGGLLRARACDGRVTSV